MSSFVKIINCLKYDNDKIFKLLSESGSIFKENIRPGDKVVIKPNWISASHKYNNKEWQSVITHPAVISAVLKIVLNCLNGKGKIIIADAPQTNSSWSNIIKLMNPDEWISLGKKSDVEIQIMDLRDHEWIEREGIIVERKKLIGDPLGSTECDLGNFSEFADHMPSRRGYYGADYNCKETNMVHSGGHNIYKVSKTIMGADVFINMPKMKTHKKAGLTCSLKNLVGINTYKNYLPHYSIGTPKESGDQFPKSSSKNKFESLLIEKFKRFLLNQKKRFLGISILMKIGKRIFGDTRFTIRSGNWHGNDTVWRMILDLNKILFYADWDGKLRPNLVKKNVKYLSVVDGIIAGEGEGPEAPDPKNVGILLVGDNPLAVDAVAAKIMGFDWRKIPQIINGFLIKNCPIADFNYDEIIVESTNPIFNKRLSEISRKDIFRFKPARGWIDHIELEDDRR